MTTIDELAQVLWPGGDIGVFGGVPVVENPLLPFDAVLMDTFTNTLIVGEVAHVRWLFWLYGQRLDARRDYQQMIEDFERSVLTAR